MRLKSIDFLRGIAILLVLPFHGLEEGLLNKMGWIGVDLFFVLSGFLVSSLIIREYQQNDKVNIKRFLIRRGLKIYPAFYFFIAVSILAKYIISKEFYPLEKIFSEIFYLQSYLPRIWGHTWSLAVEEHFYFSLALVSFLIIKKDWMGKKDFIISSLVGLLFFCFFMRFQLVMNSENESIGIFATHLRMDGIIVGILGAYLYYFTKFFQFFKKHLVKFTLLSFVLISPPFIFKGGSFYMNIIGLSSMNLGFGLIIYLALTKSFFNKILDFKIAKLSFDFIGFIGIHSYSIYLWHLLVFAILSRISSNLPFLLYMLTSIFIGIVLSLLIEKPFLRIRNKYFQSKKIKPLHL